MSSPNSLEKRRLKDRKRNFNPRWEQDFAFINFEGRPLCLICNISLTHFKSCNLKRHYETHHKKFAADYPPWSELRRNKLLALKMSRTNQHIEEPLPDRDTELVREAGRVIARSVLQSDRLLSNTEFCRQLIARVVVILDPTNARLQHLITTIPLPDRDDGSPWKTNQFQISAVPGQPIDGLIDGSVELPTSVNHQQLLADNLRRIEAASGCFICPVCPLTVDSRSFTHSDASCSDPAIFHLHLTVYHQQLKTIRCVYCCWRVQRDQYVAHVAHHFLFQSSTRASSFGVFRCPVEPECPQRFQTAQFFTMEAHWRSQHADEAQQQARFKCPHCPRTFVSLSQWAVHIQRYIRPLVHCSASGCLVKSPSRRLMLEHVQTKHASDDCDDSRLGGILINETVEVVCGRPELVPSCLVSAEPEQPVKSIDQQPSWPLAQPSNLSKADEPKFVFLLRCPYCGLTTVRWKHFLSHAAKCSGLSPNTNLISSAPTQLTYRCRIYWCSECQAVSTEKNLVAEHVTYSHDSQTTVCRETLNIRLLDSHGQSVPVSLAPSQMFFNPPNVSTLLGSSTPLPATTPLQLIAPKVAMSETEDETDSPMNLAALARPSASRYAASLTNRSAHLSVAPSSVLPSSQASSVNDSSLSLLQSAAALKTLQDLTGNSAPDVSSISASDTASAVAVMAALSGFTGFDVSNPIATANALTSMASSLSTGAKSASNTASVSNVQMSTAAETTNLDRTSDGKVDSVRCGDDLVSFPFDEVKFRKELSPHIRSNVLDSLVSKMHQFSSYFVRILGKENHRRIPVCPECEKVFPYGLGDFKRHLLTVHLEVPREYLKECLRFTYLPKSEEKFQEVQEQLAMRQMKPRMLDAGRRRVPLPYSIIILRRLTRHLPMATREFLEQKMQVYSRLSVIVDTRGGFRRYRCNHCNYSSPHALADVRKHILGSHCGISTKHFRHCLQASRLDPVEFTLFSDEKLARLAKDYMHRQHGSEAFRSAGSRASSPDDNASQNGFTEADSVISSASNSGSDRKNDGYVSHFTAVVPGSKNRVTVRIRPPVPPDMSAGSHVGSSPSAQISITSPTNGTICSPATPPRSPGSPDSPNDLLPSTTMDSLDLNTLPSIPGFEGADQIVDLPLPFSDTVLKRLLEYANASQAQTEEVLAKMNIYSSYVLSRICRGDRVIAFRCPCGRLFATMRQPDSKIRAATLADARRHVMGVHARISHEYMTICCQASRLRREHDFQLYPDNMLLELATDRTTKLGSSPCFSSNNRTSVPLPPLRPLRDLTPGNTSAAKRAKFDDTMDTDNLDYVDCSEAQSVESSADGIGGSRDLTEEERSLVDDKDSSDPNPKLNSKSVEDPLSHLHMAQASANEEVERIIDLPYSSEALHSLVMGYCPPSYFPVLEEKMDVYSSLKVFITRRRGRRYFCCSGCSSASPHGMGDIRKHILGVHAKVPERYKAAAMHCSRLSREDNTLLPNHVLLHLAKMKWKGTVIKPLAEIDLPMFGTRRASAVGLVRQTGQFASQVYQPSTQNRDTEKLTALPATNAANNRSSSPFEHVDYTSYVTTDDSTSSLSNKHSLVKPIDKSQLDLGRTHIIRMNANADQPIVEGCSLLYACSTCFILSDYVGAIRVHVVREHMHIPVHCCAYCDNQSFPTAKAAMAHHREAHPNQDFTTGQQLIDYRKALAKVIIKDLDSLLPATALAFRNSLDMGKRIESSTEEDMEDAVFLEEDELDHDDTPVVDDNLEHGSSSKLSRSDAFGFHEFSNPTVAPSIPVMANGIKVTCSFARLGPSGSSRRKPSKLQLVQLKPSVDLTLGSDQSDSIPIRSNGDCTVTPIFTQVSTE